MPWVLVVDDKAHQIEDEKPQTSPNLEWVKVDKDNVPNQGDIYEPKTDQFIPVENRDIESLDKQLVSKTFFAILNVFLAYTDTKKEALNRFDLLFEEFPSLLPLILAEEKTLLKMRLEESDVLTKFERKKILREL